VEDINSKIPIQTFPGKTGRPYPKNNQSTRDLSVQALSLTPNLTLEKCEWTGGWKGWLTQLIFSTGDDRRWHHARVRRKANSYSYSSLSPSSLFCVDLLSYLVLSLIWSLLLDHYWEASVINSVFLFSMIITISPRSTKPSHSPGVLWKRASLLWPFHSQSSWFFETGSHCVAQAGLEIEVLLPQPPQCWD
jgi:hypothetical protein